MIDAAPLVALANKGYSAVAVVVSLLIVDPPPPAPEYPEKPE